MKDDQEPSEQRGLKRKIKLFLVRPGTFQVAIVILKIVNLVAKLFDWF